MSKFPTSLPPDIVFQIFSYIDQETSTECMRVCRHWYSEIPLYTTDLWKQITVSSSSWNKTNKCMTRCLGSHVEYARIFQQDSNSILKALKGADCRLIEIDVYHGPSVVVYEQDICPDSEFLSAIKAFSSTLTELYIINHFSDIPVSQLLDYLPNLTHLTLLFQGRLRNRLSESLEGSNIGSGNDASNLIYLHLDFALSFNHRVLPVLRRCSKLKVLRLANGVSKGAHIPGSFDQIFLLCPRLHHFVWDAQDPLPPRNHIKIISEEASSGNKGIREFIFRGDVSDIDRIAGILTHARDNLEVLRLSNTVASPNHWNALAHVRFPRLKTMSLFHLDLSEAEWTPFFACRPNLVSFSYFRMYADDLYLDTMIAGISTLEHLEHLRITRLLAYTGLLQMDVWNNAGMLSLNVKLQRLELEGVNLTDNALLDLCKISSLKVLSIIASPFANGNRLEALIAFAETLQATNSKIETLTLNFFYRLDDSVLERLGQISNLSMLYLAQCHLISDAGIQSFLHGGNNGKKKRIEVHGCRQISRYGLWA